MAGRRSPWLAVAGARPNLVKLAPLVRAARAAGRALPWVHTGQHYDPALSEGPARDLGLPAPLSTLAVGPGTPTQQTARILERLEPVLRARRPAVVLVLGDVTSTLAAALAAVQAGLPVAHVEAGLRSLDESMPEERNRILVDRLSERLYVTEPAGLVHLRREGTDMRRVVPVGDPTVDALRRALPRAAGRRVAGGREILVTLHRPANVDDPRRLSAWCRALASVARSRPVVFPVHPRTRARLEARGWARRLEAAGVALVRPWPYLEFLRRLREAGAVATDSGGVQVEASVLGVPCLTLRDRTEHVLTLTHGTNRLVGDDPARLSAAVALALRRPPRPRPVGRWWDGHAARRIVGDLLRRYV